jgi:hypothetical protein
MEKDSPFINAPVWPWTLTGWLMAVTFVIMLVLAWSQS